MPYTPPSGSIDFVFPGELYAAPLGSIAFSWVVPVPTGPGEVIVVFNAVADGTFYELTSGTASVEIAFLADSVGQYLAPVYGDGLFYLDFAVAAVGKQDVQGAGFAPLSIVVSGEGRQEAQGAGNVEIAFSIAAAGGHVFYAVGNVQLGFNVVASGDYYPVIPFSINVAGLGFYGSGGSGSVTVGMSVSGTGMRGNAGLATASVAFLAAGSGKHGYGGAASFSTQINVGATGKHLQPITGFGAVGLSLLLNADGEHRMSADQQLAMLNAVSVTTKERRIYVS